jgi:hypothetical protein
MNEPGYEDISEFLNDDRNQKLYLEELERIEPDEFSIGDELVLQVEKLDEDNIAGRKGYVGQDKDNGIKFIAEESELYIPDEFVTKVNWYRISNEN